MRGLNITVVAAIAGLAVAASACEDMPTQPDNQMGALAVGASSAQDRVTLCHRSKDGDYVKITVADAAYDTHMMHGDRDAGLNDACPGIGNSLLEVQMPSFSSFGPVTVALATAIGEPITSLVECFPGQTCAYYVPTGSTVTLGDIFYYWFDWAPDNFCTYTCQMDVDRVVTVGLY